MADKQGTKGCDAAGRNTARCARYQALGHLETEGSPYIGDMLCAYVVAHSLDLFEQGGGQSVSGDLS